mgnify:CR=1 FL=1
MSVKTDCESCEGFGWIVANIWSISNRIEQSKETYAIQRCDTCQFFASDREAKASVKRLYGTTNIEKVLALQALSTPAARTA